MKVCHSELRTAGERMGLQSLLMEVSSDMFEPAQCC